MQPYLFPYIGYFQLMAAVERWVVYDDVHFIARGWINRNNLNVNGASHLFTVPLSGASQNRRIHEIGLDTLGYARWVDRFRRTLEQSYRRAPHFASAFGLVDAVLSQGAKTIAEFNLRGLVAVRDYLRLPTAIVPTSRVYGNESLRGQDRLLDICARERARVYVNAVGGKSLYDAASFAMRGVSLCFLEPADVVYSQGALPFVPNLSIIDVLMHNDVAQVRNMLTRCRLVEAVRP